MMAFDVLESTNTTLRQMLEAGTEAEEGLIVVAKSQTAWRGRGGRAWVSPQATSTHHFWSNRIAVCCVRPRSVLSQPSP